MLGKIMGGSVVAKTSRAKGGETEERDTKGRGGVLLRIVGQL